MPGLGMVTYSHTSVEDSLPQEIAVVGAAEGDRTWNIPHLELTMMMEEEEPEVDGLKLRPDAHLKPKRGC